jgi:hypothetical protein
MATRDSYRSRLEQLEAKAEREKYNSTEEEELLRHHLEERFQALAAREKAFQALTPEEQIASITKELNALSDGDYLVDYRRRHLTIEILSREGETPEVVSVARAQAMEAVRGNNEMPPIPSHSQALKLIQGGKVSGVLHPSAGKQTQVSAEPEPDPPHQGYEVPATENPKRPRETLDKLSEYRGNGTPRFLEPDF